MVGFVGANAKIKILFVGIFPSSPCGSTVTSLWLCRLFGVHPFLHLLIPGRRIDRMTVTWFQVSPPRGVLMPRSVSSSARAKGLAPHRFEDRPEIGITGRCGFGDHLADFGVAENDAASPCAAHRPHMGRISPPILSINLLKYQQFISVNCFRSPIRSPNPTDLAGFAGSSRLEEPG
jgi:hypothetical protein